MKKKPTKITRKAVARIAKNVVMSQAETKVNLHEIGSQPSLKHDVMEAGVLFSQMNQGLGDTARIGDEVYLKNLWLNIQFWSDPTNTKPTTFRFMVVRCKKDTAPTEAQLFNGANGYVRRFINREYTTPIWERTWIARNNASNTHPEVYVKRVRIPLNTKHIFDGNDSDLGKYYNYYMVCTAFSQGGVQNSTVIGSYYIDALTTYKDL